MQKEVIIGATCTLTDKGSKKEYKAKTDSFGNFWFEGLDEDVFSLKIAIDGKSKNCDSVSTEKDENLGDIPLT